MALLETLSSEAFLRKRAALKQNRIDVDDSSTSVNKAATEVAGSDALDESTASEKGTTRDKIAKAIGLRSGKTFDRMKAVIEKVDALKREDNTQDSELFLSVLNRSPSAAHDLLTVDLTSLSDEDRGRIKTGKVAPRRYVTEGKKGEASKNKTSYQKIRKEIKIMNRTMQGLNKPAAIIEKVDEINKTNEMLRTMIRNIRGLQNIVGKQSHIESGYSGTYEEFFDVSRDFSSTTSSFIEHIPNISDEGILKVCKDTVEGQIESLQMLLSAIESGLTKKSK